MTQREQVATIVITLGIEIAVSELTRNKAIAQLTRFMPKHEARAVVQFLDDADAGNSPATDAVELLLGRPALSFGAWAAEHAGDFAAER